jgi:hypothetical protein
VALFPHRLSGQIILVRKVFLAVVLCGLAGCAAGPDPKMALRYAQADLAYGPAALDRAVADFLGPPSASEGGAGDTSGNGTTGSRRGKARADIDYREIRGQEGAVMLEMRHPLAQGWHLDSSLRLGQGRTRYVVPAGRLRVAQLVYGEAVTLDARNRFIEVDSMVFRQLVPPFPGILELGAGGGLRGTDSRLQVLAPPIIIDSRHRQLQPYGAVQARYHLPHLPARGFAEARIYGRNAAGLRAGVELALP